MTLKKLACLIILPLVSLQAKAATDEIIGYVKTVKGMASVTTASKRVDAAPGTALFLGSVLNTGKDGSMGVTLKDNTVLSIGEDTELKIDKYLYKPAQDQLTLNASLLRGTLHYISGVIAKLKPDAVSITTPTGIIGVRGTRFVAKAED